MIGNRSAAAALSGKGRVRREIATKVGRTAPWLGRLALASAAIVRSMIARKFILDPVGSAALSQTHLDAPIGITNMRASFGAFPLGSSGFASRTNGELAPVDPTPELLLGRLRRMVEEVLPSLLALPAGATI